ncbi:Metallo-dependent phosphatase-like protein, partial [Thamnocephalis sphaerospora]
RIVAVGDLHGDLEATLDVLYMAGVVDSNGEWAGGNNTILVQTGDILDRGPDTVPLLELFPRLAKEANKVGGRVIQILGNHELMNLAGDYRYVNPADKGFAGPMSRYLAFSQHGRFGQRLLDLPLVHQIGDTVFAHGGITPEWARKNIHTVNTFAAKKLRELTSVVNPAKYSDVPVLGLEGPAWYRGYALGNERVVCAALKRALDIMGVKQMVTGHTLQNKGQVLTRCDGRLFVIDVGISRAYKGAQAAIDI